MTIGGLDVGSTGAKLTVIERGGRIIHTAYREYPVFRDIGVHEIHAEGIWNSVKELLTEAAVKVPDMAAVGITSFGESFVLLDERREALLPIMMYTDPRGGVEAVELSEKLGDEFISATSGALPHPMYSLPKLMWIKKHKPEIFAKAKYVCLIGDFLAFKLSGKRMIDYSLAARTLGLNVKTKKWSEEIFSAVGIDVNLFSRPVPTGTKVGALLPEISKELGLPECLQVVICCHDQVAAAIGSNVTEPGMVTDGGGTVQCMTPVFSPIPEDGLLQRDHFSIVPFLRDNTYCCYAFSFTGGSLVKWFVDKFAGEYHIQAKEKGLTVYQHMESQMSDKPTGILVLPHFAGAGTPYMDTCSKGAFVGLDLTHSPIEIFQAIMEGITYEMRINIDTLIKGGIAVHGLSATGGCAKSRRWLQMKADILGVPITRMDVDEAGTIGGIMLAGVAAGMYSGIEDAGAMLVRPIEVFQPRRDIGELYEAHYGRYKRLYGSVRPLLDGDGEHVKISDRMKRES